MTITSKTRTQHIAAADWKAVSLELQVFRTPEVMVTENRTRETVVAGKWIFFSK
jgi:hypothetical protein